MTSLVSTGHEAMRGIEQTPALIESHATAGGAVSAGRGRELQGKGATGGDGLGSVVAAFKSCQKLQYSVSRGQFV